MRFYKFLDICFSKVGITKAFGVPGSLIMPIWQNLEETEIVLCSHEQEAAYIAEGYSKISHKPVAILSTGGPGAINSIAGVAASNLDSVPMIFVSGRTECCKAGCGMRQEEGISDRNFDSVIMTACTTKLSLAINSPDELIPKTLRVIKTAILNRKGSTHISLPVDLQSYEIDDSKAKVALQELDFHRNNFKCDYSIYNEIIHNDCKSIIIVGWGCWQGDCIDEIYQLSSKIDAPILFTSKAYCCMKDYDKCLGKLGYGINDVLLDFISQYSPQRVLAFGTSMSEKDFSDSIKNVIEKSEIFVFSNAVNDSRVHLPQAKWCEIDNLKEFVKYYIQNCNMVFFNHHKTPREIYEIQFNTYLSMISDFDKMADMLCVLNDYMESDVVVNADAGNNLLNVATLIKPKNIFNLFLDDGIRAMGSGLCQIAGMAFANTAKRYIAIVGDGGILMNGNVLYFIKKHNLPILVIIFDNNSLGRVRIGQLLTKNYVESDLGNVDFISYAESFGIEAYQVNDKNDFSNHICSFLQNRMPKVVCIKTNKDEIPISLKLKGTWN